MLPDRVSNPGPLTYESGALLSALRGPNTCCWRADHEILIHSSLRCGELIFVSARQHVLISDNSLVRKNYFDSNIR